MANSINFIQINANHSFTASEHLKINQQLESHITCIQEPYYLKNKIIGFPLRFHHCSTDQTKSSQNYPS